MLYHFFPATAGHCGSLRDLYCDLGYIPPKPFRALRGLAKITLQGFYSCQVYSKKEQVVVSTVSTAGLDPKPSDPDIIAIIPARKNISF